MTNTLEYNRSEILESINGKGIAIPTFEHIGEISKAINECIEPTRIEDETLGVAAYKIIILLKLGMGKKIDEVCFKGLLNTDGIEWSGKIKKEEFDVEFDEIYQGRTLKIAIPERERKQPRDDKYIELPQVFKGELIETGIGIMGELEVGGKKINITNHNF